MLGELNQEQIDKLLKEEVTGRLGCHADGRTYIVPVNYIYDGKCLYAHSADGMKIEMMRKNPEICFEVDRVENVYRWQSVILWGTFEEITDLEEKQRVMQGIIHRLMPLVNNPSGHPSHGITANEYDVGTKIELIIYRIVIHEKSGRFEQG